ncbi:hypothetical protein EV426DRAFT_701998 [Tirmania nivea]|nr:hypothetical protein EV426DRAFT_701998 [Tirmania nivea]
MIQEARERVGVLANAQVQIIEQATDSELTSWGVIRKKAKDKLRYDELERLGRIYKSAVIKWQNNNITTEKWYFNGKPPLLITITTTTKKISKGRMSKGESYRTGKKAKDKCNGKILDLLDNLTLEKYTKLEPEVEGMDEDSYEILLDVRIIHCLNIVLNSERLIVHPVLRNTTLPPILTKLYTMSSKEHEEEDDDEEEEEEENNEEED